MAPPGARNIPDHVLPHQSPISAGIPANALTPQSVSSSSSSPTTSRPKLPLSEKGRRGSTNETSSYPDWTSKEKAYSHQTTPYSAEYWAIPSAPNTQYSRLGWLVAILIFLLFWKDSLSHCYGFLTTASGEPTPSKPVKEENPILNRTLGFQKIFVLALPERADRREPLLAGGNATNITITVIDGIKDRQIPDSSKPSGWSQNGWTAKEGELGCLMSHYRTWQKMIHENISSAIILESDVDWDMRIKESMVGIGRGSRALADWPFDPEPDEIEEEDEGDGQKSDTERLLTDDRKHPANRTLTKIPPEKPQPAPYGIKWDLLWIGHCGSHADGEKRIFTFNDSSAPDEVHAWSYGGRPTTTDRQPGTRIMYNPRSSVCTTGYAISLQGARKFEQLFREANSPIDLKMWDACANKPNFNCLGVWPQVFSMTESRGNIRHTQGGLSLGHEITEERIVAGKGIQVSARVNAQKGTIDKGPEGWTWEW